jgi:pyridoxal 5'-phosphate synthase pdxS subunit
MATELPTTNGHGAHDGEDAFAVKAGLARMLKGGVIMDVVNAEQVCSHSMLTLYTRKSIDGETLCYAAIWNISLTIYQARIAEEAGASAVMALERVPADIRAQGGVARMSDPKMIKEIMDSVTIPVMAKARIGHFVECQVSCPYARRTTNPKMQPYRSTTLTSSSTF